MACDIGALIRALGTHWNAVRHLTREVPDRLLTGLAEAFRNRTALGIAGFHLLGFD